MLIDADNVSYRNIKDMTDELARFGNLTIKRIYGDFTKSSMNGYGVDKYFIVYIIHEKMTI